MAFRLAPGETPTEYLAKRDELVLMAEHRADQLRRALEFYADPKSWDHIDPVRGTVTTRYPASEDEGRRAREALEDGSR